MIYFEIIKSVCQAARGGARDLYILYIHLDIMVNLARCVLVHGHPPRPRKDEKGRRFRARGELAVVDEESSRDMVG